MTEESKKTQEEKERALLQGSKRVVVKIGTNVLMTSQDKTELRYRSLIRDILSQVSEMMQRGLDVVLVSSGAIGLGSEELGLVPPVTDVRLRQASAALGQPRLLELYRSIGKEFSIRCAQVLVTRNDFNQRSTYETIKNCLTALLRAGVLPIINENDPVSTEEIEDIFGDNDQLSAVIASKLEADLLVILTDIDSLYTKNPRKNKDVKRLSLVRDARALLKEQEDAETKNAETGTNYGTGGMYTKVKAASITQQIGCTLCIASAFEEKVLLRILNGEDIGTLFPVQKTLEESKRWFFHARETGQITLTSQGLSSFLSGAKLGWKDLQSLQGDFGKGEVLLINDMYKCISLCSSVFIRSYMAEKEDAESLVLCDPENIIKL